MLSITSDMSEKQGLDPDKWYEAVVIENDDREHPDKMMLGRVQARIKTIFDGIEDKNLPWAVPIYMHVDGAQPIAGIFSVPKKDAKVFLRFQQGNPSFPMYRGYHVDVLTQMQEIKYNYPDRTVVRFSNKALLIVDTKNDCMYMRNPGNVKVFIDGNAAIEINGSVDELIHGSVRRMIKGDLDETIVGDVRRLVIGDQQETNTGNVNRSNKGTIAEEYDGDRSYRTNGSVSESVTGSVHRYSGGDALYEAGGSLSLEGSTIFENCGKAKGDPHASPSGPREHRKSPRGKDMPTSSGAGGGFPSGGMSGNPFSAAGSILSGLQGLLGSLLPGDGLLKNLLGIPELPDQPRFFYWPGVPGSAKGTNDHEDDDQTKETAAEECEFYLRDFIPITVNPHIPTLPDIPFDDSSIPSIITG